MSNNDKVLKDLEHAGVISRIVQAQSLLIGKHLNEVQPVLESSIEYNALDDEVHFLFSVAPDEGEQENSIVITQEITYFQDVTHLPAGCAEVINSSLNDFVDAIANNGTPLMVTTNDVNPFTITTEMLNYSAIIKAMTQMIDTLALSSPQTQNEVVRQTRNSGKVITSALDNAQDMIERESLQLHASFIDLMGVELRKFILSNYDEEGNKTLDNLLITFEQD